MTEITQLKPRRKPAPTGGSMDELALKVGIVMGEITGIKAQIAQGDAQRTRMERKIDDMPDAFRDAFAPLAAQLAEGIKAHGARLDDHARSIAQLEQSDAVQKASIETIDKWKAKALAALAALMAVVTGAVGLLGLTYHK